METNVFYDLGFEVTDCHSACSLWEETILGLEYQCERIIEGCLGASLPECLTFFNKIPKKVISHLVLLYSTLRMLCFVCVCVSGCVKKGI